MALKVGVTGGIGAGKSVVCKIFSILGAPVYDADTQAKILMSSSPTLIQSIKESFGEESYLDGGILNRSFLAGKVFSDPKQVAKLNSIVHPAVAIDYMLWAEQHEYSPYIINEAALMIESGSYKKLDKVITVSAPKEIRIQRVLKRDPQRDIEQVRAIIDKQLSEVERQEIAHYVINNDGQQMVLPQLLKLHNELISITKA